jgi:hypothetical protein
MIFVPSLLEPLQQKTHPRRSNGLIGHPTMILSVSRLAVPVGPASLWVEPVGRSS